MYATNIIVALLTFFAGSIEGQEGVDPICEGWDDFHAHQNCSLFYHCSNGVPELEECPDGLFWNTEYDTCDFPVNVPECVGGTRAPDSTTPATTQTTSTPTTSTPTTTTPTTTTPTTTTPTTSTPTTTTPTTTTPTTTIPTTPTPSRPGCGETLTAASGYIDYKRTTNYENNERCLWTVAVPRTTRIEFFVEEYTATDESDGILITGVTQGNASLHVHRLNKTGDSCGTTMNVGIVMFYSDGAIVGTGFRLRYTVTTSSTGIVLLQNFMLSRPYETIIRKNYVAHELSTYVYSPGFTFVESTTVQVNVSTNGMEQNCYRENIAAYKLNLDGTNAPTWTKAPPFCFNPDGRSLSTNDTLLIVFQIDHTATGAGFTLKFHGE